MVELRVDAAQPQTREQRKAEDVEGAKDHDRRGEARLA